MKKKSFLFGLIVLILSIFFISCEKDENLIDTHNHSHNDENIISFREFIDKTKIKNFNANINLLDNNSQNLRQATDFTGFIIDTTLVKQRLQESGNYTFTLPVIPQPYINTDNLFYNIVFYKASNTWQWSVLEYENISTNSKNYIVKEIVNESNHNGLVNMRLQGVWSTTTTFHCTQTGTCASGTCDMCHLCVTTTTTYEYVSLEDPTSQFEIIEDYINTGGGSGGLSSALQSYFNTLTSDNERGIFLSNTSLQNYLQNNTITVPNPHYNPRTTGLLGGVSETIEIVTPEAQQFADELIDFAVDNQNNPNALEIFNDLLNKLNEPDFDIQLAKLTLNVFQENVPWTPSSGNFNNIPSLQYTHVRTTLVNGQNCYQYRLTNGDFLAQMNYSTSWQEQHFKTFYYSQTLKDWYEIPEPTPNTNYNHTDLDFIFNGFWSLVQTTTRYCTPLEDAIILIEGKDFDGVASSKALAGVFILVDIVPGGKVFKITKKAGYALSAASPVVKRVVTTLYKTQRGLRKEYKLVISNMSNIRKGNFGEICTDLDFYEKGYEVLHVNRVSNIDTPAQTGIDHIFKNPETGEFIIVESKFHGTGGLSTLVDGTRQMSDIWIKGTDDNILNNQNRLWMALGQNTSLYNQAKLNYKRVIAYIQPDGTINYKYVTSQGYEINTVQGVFTN